MKTREEILRAIELLEILEARATAVGHQQSVEIASSNISVLYWAIGGPSSFQESFIDGLEEQLVKEKKIAKAHEN